MSHKFNPGDKVRCIDASGCSKIFVGSVYTVKTYVKTYNYCLVLEEVGDQGCYIQDRFELVEPVSLVGKTVTAAEHDRQMTELLNHNNDLREQLRSAKREIARLDDELSELNELKEALVPLIRFVFQHGWDERNIPDRI